MKMKLIIRYVFILLMSCYQIGHGQQTNNWYFGSAAGFPNTGMRVDFSSGSPVVSTGYPLMTEEGSSSISDPVTGAPLFYTDGVNVWSGTTNTTVTGGTGLLGNASTSQSAIVMPISTTRWIIFTNGATGAGVNYYTVTGPAPYSVSGATNLAGPNVVGEGLTVVGSTKGGSSAFWVVARDIGATGGVRAWEVSNTGVVTAAPVTSTMSGGSYSHTDYTSKIGTIKSNTCQNQLAFTYLNNRADITDFNAATGQVTAGTAKSIAVVSGGGDSGSYGIEFSPNDDYLFITNLAGGKVYRHTVGGAGATEIGTTTASAETGQLQLGPDGVIYMARRNFAPSSGDSYLSTISNPDGGGSFTEFALMLTSVTNGSGNKGFAYRGLPTFPKSLVVTNPVITRPGADTTICLNSSITFDYIYGGSIKSPLASNLKWEIFVNSATATATYNTLNPTHVFNTLPTVAGTPFKVRVTITDECNRIWKDSVNVTVTQPKVPAGSVSCAANSITLNATGAIPGDYSKYVWYNASSGGTPYGFGSPLVINSPDQSNAPSSFWVEVANAASSTSAGSGNLEPTTASMTWTDAAINPMTFDVVANKITLNSVSVIPNGFFVAGGLCSNLNFNLTIRNSSSAIIYSKNYSYPAATCNTVLTIPIGADILKGNGYSIDINTTSPANISFVTNFSHASSTLTLSGNTIIRNYKPTTGYSYMGNWNVSYSNFSITPTCSQRVLVTRTCTLPVELTTFEGIRKGSQVYLTWTTASEVNNDYFILEGSYDGINFEPVAKIKGKGTTNQNLHYAYIHNNPSSSITYYRLVQYDLDGVHETKSTIAVDGTKLEEITVFPNPSTSNFKIIVPTTQEASTITVLDILGRVIYSKETITEEREITLGDGWISGHYILIWVSESNSQTLHLIKD